jgi:hypothetical protein
MELRDSEERRGSEVRQVLRVLRVRQALRVLRVRQALRALRL